MTSGLRSPISYPGGKSRMNGTILAHAPKTFDTYVEPFAGSASTFFALSEPGRINVLADLDPQLVRFYKQFQKDGCRQLKPCVEKNPPTLATTKKVTRQFREGSSDVCPYFLARRLSFNSNGKDMNLSHKKTGKVGKTVLSKCDEIQARLKKAVVLNQDFRDVVKKYDGPKTFVFMDPPYAMRAKGLYKFEDVTPQQVCDVARTAEGKVLITHYDNREVRQACKGLHMKSVPHKYVSRNRNHGKVHRVRELLIANFPLR